MESRANVLFRDVLITTKKFIFSATRPNKGSHVIKIQKSLENLKLSAINVRYVLKPSNEKRTRLILFNDFSKTRNEEFKFSW